MRRELDEILTNVDLVDWLDTNGVDYRKGSTDQVQIRECPFCRDDRFKCYVSTVNRRGICFSGDCGRSFNLFSFAREQLGLTNRDTIRHFEDYARGAGLIARRVTPPLITPHADGWELPKSEPLPTEDGATHPYLIARRITLETQARFQLRWCEDGWYRFRKSTGEQSGTNFGGRIIIPVFDLDGSLQSFQGRDGTGTADDVTRKRYLFPSRLPGTGRFLYGAHLARGCEHLVMGEGPFDTMAIHQSIEGHPDFKRVGAIGSFGLSVGHGDDQGDDQLGRFRSLKREGLRRLTILWDGEIGAFRAALETGTLLRRQGLEVAIGCLPAGKDPNEVDTEVVRRAVRDALVLTDQSYFQARFHPPYR